MSVSNKLPSNIQAAPFGTNNPAGRRRQRPQPIVLLKGSAQGLEHTGDRGLDAIQQRIANAVGISKANPLGASNFIQNVTFVANTPLTVQHGLGRAFVSCLVCAPSAAGNLYVQRAAKVTRPPSTQNVLDQRQITVTYTSSCTADILVW